MVAAAPADRPNADQTVCDPGAVDAVAAFDPLVVNPGRLSILLALAAADAGVEFVDLRRRTRLTDGNLACHARRLADGGLVGIDKQFRAGKPVTTYLLTDSGRRALAAHVDELVSAVRTTPPADPGPLTRHDPRTTESRLVGTIDHATEEDWID